MKLKTPLILLLAITLTSCSIFKKEVEPREVIVRNVPVPVEIYQPPLPREIDLRDVSDGTVVITRDNLEEKIAEVEKLLGGEFVVIAYIPAAYENIAWNLQEMRRYTNQLTEIVIYYRKATQISQDVDGDGDVDIDDWILESDRMRKEELPQTD